GLEECGLYPKAEEVGMRALEHNARDVWALHAVVHTHEMRGRIQTGLRLLDERRADWTAGNVLVVHNSWHEALLLLDAGEVGRALDIYDTTVHHAGSAKVALEMLDAAALLWRLHLDGADAGGRWKVLAEAWAEKLDLPWYVFNDMHAVMSFVGAGRLEDARALVDRLAVYVASGPRPSVANVAMTAEVGLPVCSAIVAFGEARYGDVVELLHPIRNIVHRFGGSHAQRDAIARTLFEAAIRAGEADLAFALASERLAVKEASPYTWRQLARIRRTTGETTAAAVADIKAKNLRASAAA
ncbi:MAG: tetratricopeptide repeat protein, partial [Actinomycetota bacterium]|nr:tetratricopeptide repeat protein [Actinomycetota bacterium]